MWAVATTAARVLGMSTEWWGGGATAVARLAACLRLRVCVGLDVSALGPTWVPPVFDPGVCEGVCGFEIVPQNRG